MDSIMEQIKTCKGHENIDATAVEYYMSNHALHVLQSRYGNETILPSEVSAAMTEQKERLNRIALRMFAYLVYIGEEEARFGSARTPALFDFIGNSVGQGGSEYAKAILERSSSVSKERANLNIGQALKVVEMIFRFGQWSPGFGGLAWAQIVNVAQEVVQGSNSMDLMVDKAFTLSHNNGAIFNKGHVFSMYSSHFYSILDIQASGQIPQAYKSSGISAFKDVHVKQCYERFLPLCREDFEKAFDSKKVKSMEAVRAAKEKAQQQKIAAYYAKHSGSHSGTVQKVQAPPVRACDNLISVDDYESLREESTHRQGFKIPKR